MCNNPQLLPKEKRIALIIPSAILYDHRLSLNDKLILGIDYCFKKKLNYNSMPNTQIGYLLQLHPNIISKSRRKLLKLGYLRKEKRNYYLNDINLFVKKQDQRDLIIPFLVYNSNLSSGAKLLWAEYNSFNNNGKSYYASREFTSKRLDCSVESISNWTTALQETGFLKHYELKSGYCTKQRLVVTCKFSKDGMECLVLLI